VVVESSWMALLSRGFPVLVSPELSWTTSKPSQSAGQSVWHLLPSLLDTFAGRFCFPLSHASTNSINPIRNYLRLIGVRSWRRSFCVSVLASMEMESWRLVANHLFSARTQNTVISLIVLLRKKTARVHFLYVHLKENRLLVKWACSGL
jgi:hypothetical protein